VKFIKAKLLFIKNMFIANTIISLWTIVNNYSTYIVTPVGK